MLVFDAEKPESFEKLTKCFEDIKATMLNSEIKAILVAMHNKKKVYFFIFLTNFYLFHIFQEIDLSKAKKFVEEHNIKEFFKVYRENKCNITVFT